MSMRNSLSRVQMYKSPVVDRFFDHLVMALALLSFGLRRLH